MIPILKAYSSKIRDNEDTLSRLYTQACGGMASVHVSIALWELMGLMYTSNGDSSKFFTRTVNSHLWHAVLWAAWPSFTAIGWEVTKLTYAVTVSSGYHLGGLMKKVHRRAETYLGLE